MKLWCRDETLTHKMSNAEMNEVELVNRERERERGKKLLATTKSHTENHITVSQ